MKNNTGSTVTAVVITLGIMLVIGSFLKASKPKCSMTGCREKRLSNSKYCVMHDLSYRSYGNPDYHAVYRSNQQRRQQADADIEKKKNKQTEKTTWENSSSNSTNTKSSYSGKSYVKKAYDPYDADDYDNADDFAEEWAEEFGDGNYDDGYDDAYYYWEERD